ncbi:putative nuclear RNA export factor SDE5 isoform X2 [Spinacia oleracea]|uniref:Nuclear RNA export factor SDE5 isoform X2 n=1 Tax=Spinacia oleracea TaxID=3562 RepID=A0ABM3QJB1_SPIOL|nr:putative nuclear RNA export factor SDE5 isoform X2 [Spinacia oleracea]
METVSSCSSSFRDCNTDMELLLEAFGSSFSLETLTSAYSQANSNVEMAGVILCELQGATAVSQESKDGMDVAYLSSVGLSTEGNGTGPADNHVPGLKSTMSTNEFPRIQSSEMHANESLTASCSNTGKDDNMHEDIGEFLFRMLGDGFQLDTKVIHEVLGFCGYDLEKSVEKLVDLSASTLEKSDDVSVCAEKEMYVYLKNGSISEKSQSGVSLSNDRLVRQNGKESRKKNNDKYDLQREILGALFSGPERVEQIPKKTSARSRRSRMHGRTAVEPVKETNIEKTFVTVKPLAGHNEVEEKEDENSFPVLRQAVKENWATMKDYCKAATDAYAKGDRVRAYKLMKECQFYNRKAREADEKSAHKLTETSSEDELLLDISTFELKEAIKLLKVQLSNFAGILSYLKVFVGDDGGENRKKRLCRF